MMENRWNEWAKHVLHCAQCTHVLSTVGNLNNNTADKLCPEGNRLYTSYRLTTVRL